MCACVCVRSIGGNDRERYIAAVRRAGGTDNETTIKYKKITISADGRINTN